jgi:alginate O-acetyltransferase complex protein AlgI
MPGSLNIETTSPISAARESRPAVDSKALLSRPNATRFALLAAQLALLLAVFRLFRVEQISTADSGFFLTCSIAFAGFAVHYWLPFSFKEPFSIALSLASAALLLEWRIAAALICAGAAFYLLLNSRLAYWHRIAFLAAGGAVLMMMRRHPVGINRLLGPLHIPVGFWPVFGGIFMFRMIVYAYDVRFMRGRLPLKEYLSYFFILPNYYFQLFPVVDYRSMRLSYYRRDIHDIAQQGIFWMCRGATQLLLYRVVCYFRDLLSVRDGTSPGSLLGVMVLTYLLYLRVSGQFHVAVGMLHLFGFDLPETNRKYFLARSLVDFWRRINIYWKDFMVKIVYFPVYFRLRKGSERRAQLLATGAVFAVTWALHSYQSFWFAGTFPVTLPDTAFWAALGLLVMINVWLDATKARRPSVMRGPLSWLRQALQVAGTFALMTTLWSLWSSPSLGSWVTTIRRGFGFD